MKRILTLTVLLLNTILHYGQITGNKLYFDENSYIISDVCEYQKEITCTFQNYSLLDSVSFKTVALPSYTSISANQTVLNETFVPVNCTYSILSTTTDTKGNTFYTISLKNITSSNFSLKINNQVVNQTNLTGFQDCPFNPSTIAALPTEITQFLEATNTIQKDDPEIKSLAMEITKNSRTIAEMVEDIVYWCDYNINYDYSLSQEGIDAKSVLQDKSTICTGYSNLACAMLRSLGIPARVASGIVVSSDYIKSNVNSFGYPSTGGHAWIEVYYPSLGEWVPSEPQRNSNFISPSCLKIGVDPYTSYNIWPYMYTGTGTISINSNVINDVSINFVGTNVVEKEFAIDDDFLDYRYCLKNSRKLCESTNLPNAALEIVGENQVCSGELLTYTVSNIENATSYEWTLYDGTKQITAQNSIQITIPTNISFYNLSVCGVNSYGKGESFIKQIQVATVPVNPVLIPEQSDMCSGLEEFTYTNTTASQFCNLKVIDFNCSYSKYDNLISFINFSSKSIVYLDVQNQSTIGCGNSEVVSFSKDVISIAPTPILEIDSLFVCESSLEIPEFSIQNPTDSISWNYEYLNSKTYTPSKPIANSFQEILVWQDIKGCETSEAVVAKIYTGAEISMPIISETVDKNLEVSSVNTLEWYKDDILMNVGNVQHISPENETANYYVIATDEKGCSVESDLYSFVFVPITTSISNTDDNTILFQKIAQNSYSIQCADPSVVISVYNVLGEVIERINPNDTFSYLNLAEYSAGVYKVVVETSLQSKVFTIVK